MSVTAAHTRQERPTRIPELDALRGFALAGILLVNALMMAGPHGLGVVDDPTASVSDRIVEGLVQTFAVGKFYLLFSFLFGYSFTLQLTSAESDGARAVPRHLRRTLGLLVLGILHAVLLYVGDILVTYALFGLVLIAARNCSPGAALRAARIVYGCAAVPLLLLGTFSLLMPDAETAAADAELAASFPALIIGYRGDAASVVAANIGQLPDALLSALVMGGFVLPAFLVGLHCGKLRLLADTGRHRARMRRICLLGTATGLPGSVFMALAVSGPLGPRWALFGELVGMVTAPALTAAYVCGMLLFLDTARGARVTALLAPMRPDGPDELPQPVPGHGPRLHRVRIRPLRPPRAGRRRTGRPRAVRRPARRQRTADGPPPVRAGGVVPAGRDPGQAPARRGPPGRRGVTSRTGPGEPRKRAGRDGVQDHNLEPCPRKRTPQRSRPPRRSSRC